MIRHRLIHVLAVVGLGGCAPVNRPLPAGEQSAIEAGPLRAQLSRPLTEQRAMMVAKIRADLRSFATSAVTPAFERALAIVAKTPRQEFVLPAGRRFAYVDLPQQIGHEQTISDPYIVTVMTAALEIPPGATVLDIGTGSGYQAAILSPLASRVFSIEIVDQLAQSAAARLHRLRYTNVEVRSGDGFAGWPEHAPFDGIVVAAGAAEVPRPLIDQLKPGARLVMPIGPTFASEQILVLTKQSDGSTTRCSLGPAMFVDLTGQGQTPAGNRGILDRTIPFCFGAPIT